METTIVILKAFLIAWFIVNFEPYQNIREQYLAKRKNFFVQLLSKITACIKCSAFYAGLILSGNIYYAIGASIMGWLFSNIKNRLKFI